MRRSTSCVSVVGITLISILPALIVAQSRAEKDLLATRPATRITSPIEDEQRVALLGNRHPLSASMEELGAVPAERVLERMILVLRPSTEQQEALESLVAAQQNPSSPYYHHWLTPAGYGQRFGIADSDLEQIQAWLLRQGLSIDEISPNKRTILFSGTVAQVESAFHTTMRYYAAGNTVHMANATDPEIPAAIAGVVEGVASLHDFFSRPLSHAQTISPEMTTGGSHYLAPADFATIYDVRSLYNQGYDGTGQTIAIVARSNISLSDVQKFRGQFSLPTNAPYVILVNTDPGTGSGDFGEAMLDVEWSGAVAKGATIEFVVAASTAVSDGVFLSAEYIVNHNLAPVMSLSYGACEADMGAAENSLINSLWQQAAAQGISVFVSAGDSGAAGCDSSSSTRATGGKAINGLCSPPYSTCVGGTQFDDTANPTLYWSNNNASDSSSALSYIPEKVWNESGSSGLWSTGGGVSILYSKPSWQNVNGVPADGMRDVPDVALSSAGHVAYAVVMNGSTWYFYGTSAAAPSFAGIMSLAVQAAHGPQGNANPTLYKLAGRQLSAAGPAAFHDVTAGNNSVPGVAGFSAGTGYDAATGLGSVDATVLVTHWTDNTSAPALGLTVASPSVSLQAGASATVVLTSTVSGGLNAKVTLSLSGLPAGVTATFAPAAIAAPGSGSSTLKLTAASGATVGSSTVTLQASGGGLTTATQVRVIVLPAPTLTLLASQPSAAVLPGGSSTLNLTTTGNSTFNAPVSLSPSGLPSGLTASLTPATVPAPGSGTSVLTIAASVSVAAGNYSLAITATGGGLSSVVHISVAVQGLVVKSSANPSTYGSPLTFTATTYGLSQTEITFHDGGTPLGTSLAATNGIASFTTTVLQPGIHSITVTAAGYAVTSPAISVSLKAVLTVAAGNASRIYGTANPTFSVTYSGWVGRDTLAVLAGTPNLTTTATAASAVGTYPITVTTGTLAAANYTFKFVPGTLSVTKSTPAIALTSSANPSSYGARVSFTATISSGGPAGTVYFYDGAASMGSSNLSGTTATLTTSSLKAGSHSITASLGGANYNPVTSAAIAQTVNKAVLTVTANKTVTYGATSLGLTPSYSGWVNGDTAGVLSGAPSLLPTAPTVAPVGTYPITVTSGTLAAANYIFQYTPGTLTVVKAVLTVTANNASRIYGAANPPFAATYSGWVNGDTASVLTGTPALTTRATTASAVGAYPITATAGTLSTVNYSFKFVPGTLTVTGLH